MNSERNRIKQSQQPPSQRTLDRLEVVHDRDPQPRDRVERGQHDDVGGHGAEEHLPREPGKRDVGAPERVVADPAALLQLQRRRRVDVGDAGAEEREPEERRRRVAGRLVERVGDREAGAEEDEDLGDDVALGDGPRGDRAVRLVDRVDLAVVPVVDRLAGVGGWGGGC